MYNFDFQPILMLAQQMGNHPRDLLVAVISIGLGCNIFYAVTTNNERCFELGSVQYLEQSLGRNNARLILYAIGSLCVFLGFFLIVQVAKERKGRLTGETTRPQPAANMVTHYH